MPTPVHVARQCLTPEASHALDEAVSVARRRSHAQTTSLHAVSALLSLPSSTLREACARARNSAYSPRLQFKALDLCLGVSLDRVPSGQLADEPPVSNSLMAAIKRSQANQRRQPENFHLYQQISNQSSITTVKVELQHLILSILDDPVVSRVFGEAGFRSSEIKLAILRPLPQFLRYSKARGPPLFLCNLTENPEPIRRNFSFPFPGVADGDENSRRIAEVLCRTKGRNPLLVGVCAYDALQSFAEAVQRRKYGTFPAELAGIDAICMENDVARFTIDNSDKGCLDSRLSEVRRAAKQSLGAGLVVNYGDLKSFVAESASADAASYVVSQLTSLAAVPGGKLWLVGSAVSYEMYLKFVSKFPTVEKDWDLQLLPITSLKPDMAESYPRSSLMESFVPFGGFFSAPSELRGPSMGAYQCRPRCHLCNDKCEQEVFALSKGGFSTSVADHYQSTLPSWLQMSALATHKTQDDDGALLSVKIAGLQKKWDGICQRLHHSQQFPEAKTYQDASRFPTVMGFQFVQENKANSHNHSCSNVSENESPNSIDLQNKSTSHQGFSSPMAKNESFLSKLWVKNSNAEDGDHRSCSLSNSSVGDGSRASPTSGTSVTTDLGLGMGSASNSREPKNASNQHLIELPQDLSGCSSANVNPIQTSSSNPRDMKMIFRALMDCVAWQKEAISVISQTIALCQTRNGKRRGADMWLHFSGPDRSAKKKTALALSKILYGSGDNCIHLDLSSKDGMSNYDDKFRGKTAIDYLAAELFKNPLSVVFLENVDKADGLVHNSLSRAVQTGKFSDTHGREVSINNATFVTTSASTKGGEPSCYGEDRIVGARGWPIQIVIRHKSGASVSDPIFMNKRKPIGGSEVLERQTSLEMAKRAHKGSTSTRCLDLNLPAQESEVLDIDSGSSDNDSLSGNYSANWLQVFLDQVDETVVFEPFDFDALAEKISKEVKHAFCSVFGQDCTLEIEPKVMEQLLSAGYLSDRDRVVEDWVEQVLKRGFVEIHDRFDNLNVHCVVKAVVDEEVPLRDRELGMCLPSRIIVN